MNTNTLSKFEKYVLANHKDDLHDIAEHGISAGFAGLESRYDTVKLYDKFANDLHRMLAEYLDDSGGNMPKSLIKSLKEDAISFKNWMTWFGVEEIAQGFVDDAFSDYGIDEDDEEATKENTDEKNTATEKE